MKKRLPLLLLALLLAASAGPASLCAYAYGGPGKKYVDPSMWWEYPQDSHTLQTVSLYSAPDRYFYFVGETLDTEGLALALSFADGDEQLEYGGFRCYPTTLLYAGNQWIDVEYAGLHTGFYVSVMDNSQISGLEIFQMPDKLDYKPGETLDMTGLKVRILYNDGRELVTTSGFTCTPATLKVEGTQTITVSYEGTTVCFDVSVADPERIVGISLASPPDKTEYKPGETPDLSGLRITVSKANGEETVETADSSRVRVSPERFDEPGRQTVTVTYQDGGEFSCEFPVQVTAAETPEPAEETPGKETAEKTVSGVWILPALIAAALMAYAFYALRKNKDTPAGKLIKEKLTLRRENGNKENKERTGEDHHEV